MKNGKFFILSGPSGSGKTTLYKKVIENKKIQKVIKKTVSVTTRAKRKGEKESIDYYFISKRMFFYKKNKGLLLESAKVFDNYYGTPKKEAESILKSGKNVLLSIDVQGAKKILKKYPDAVTIFIITPSFQILKKRLEARNSESKKSLKVRLNIAKKELLERKKYKYSVINDDLNKACKTLQNIILSEIGNK